MKLALAFAALLACAPAAGADTIPRLTFTYDKAAPLAYVDHGRVNAGSKPVAVHDVSFRSGGRTIKGYLLLPRGAKRRPAVIFAHGEGANRSELLPEAARLAARGVVALTITTPSSAVTSSPHTLPALLAQARSLSVNDTVAVRRAVDVLQSLPAVDPKRIGYIGWSLGSHTGTYLAAEEPRLKALALLSIGVDLLAHYVRQAPAGTGAEVRRALGSVDPMRYLAWARPGSVLIEDGRRDEVVPRAALLNVIRVAPKRTVVRWYDAPHALDGRAWDDAFNWSMRKLAS